MMRVIKRAMFGRGNYRRKGSNPMPPTAQPPLPPSPPANRPTWDARADRPAKDVLRVLLSDPRYTWRRLERLANVIGADRSTTTRLLLELGARASGNNPELWALPAPQMPVNPTCQHCDDERAVDGISLEDCRACGTTCCDECFEQFHSSGPCEPNGRGRD